MKKNYIILSIFIIVFLVSCNTEIDFNGSSAEQENGMSSQKVTPDSIVLENAYSVQMMKSALNDIKKRVALNNNSKKTVANNKQNTTGLDSNLLENFVVQTSHKYIKFNPSNKAEEDLLKDDTNMVLLDYRLDYEYSDEFLRNRPVDSDSIPHYYTAVPVDKIMPNVPYEVLDELYIPEQDPFFADVVDVDEYEVTYDIQNKTDFFFTLIANAHEQADTFENVGYVLPPKGGIPDPMHTHDVDRVGLRMIFGTRWRPAGRIRVEDTSKNNIYPVEGAKVLIRQGFTMTSGITNANGEFSAGLVRGNAKYVLQWERHHFSIRTGWFGQAETKSPSMHAQNWNCDIIRSQGQHAWYYATIFQAAHDYYYKDILGLHRPQLNTFWNSQMKIAARESTSSSAHFNQVAAFGIFPSIYINTWDNPSERVYGVTIHELAHSAHREMGINAYASLVWKAYIEPEAWFNDTDKYKSAKRVLESWATAVEITLTRLRYQRLNAPFNNYLATQNEPTGNYQYIPLSYDDSRNTFYTSAYFDLTDNVNQRFVFGLRMPVDDVQGFSIKQVEDLVKDSRSWGEVKEKFIANYSENNRGMQVNNFLSQWQ